MHILIVEDDEDLRNSYVKQIKLFNLDQQDVNITYDLAKNYEEGESKLESNYDIVILDLKLVRGGLEYKGRELLTKVKKELRYITYVITGNPEVVEEEASNQNTFFKIRVKGEKNSDFTVILKELIKIYNTGITNILNKKGTIERYLTNIFWNHLSNSMDLWVNDDARNSEEKEKSLLRYTLLHMQEYLEISTSGNLEKYHPAEFYISEPVKNNIFTGDIVVFEDGTRHIVLSPACDIDLKNGVRKSKKILFLKIVNPIDIDVEFNNPKMSKSKQGELKAHIRNTRPRYHFTPNAGNILKGFIDFQNKLTIEDTLIDEHLQNGLKQRIATISSPFLKDIIARYSAYYSRQGSPDFDEKEILDGFLN